MDSINVIIIDRSNFAPPITNVRHVYFVFFFNELSAGVGRTGAYIAIDSLIENINNKKNIDVFNKVLEIRLYRVSMVQNQFQYRFIYEMLNYYYKRGIIYICIS